MEYKDQSAKDLTLHANGGLSVPHSESLTTISIDLGNGIKVEGHIIGASHWVKVWDDGSSPFGSRCLFSEILACCPFDQPDNIGKDMTGLVSGFQEELGTISSNIDLDTIHYESEVKTLVSEYNKTWIEEDFRNSERDVESSCWFTFPDEGEGQSPRTALKVWRHEDEENKFYIESIHEYNSENKIVISKSTVTIK